MDAIQMLLEGSGDVLFLKHLLSHMEPKLVGCWRECVPTNQRPIGVDAQIRRPNLTYKAKWQRKLIVMRAMRGVNNIFPMLDPMLKTFSYEIEEPTAKIAKNIFVVDADCASNHAGTGGIAAAREKISREIQKCLAFGLDCAGFAMPTNTEDGTLENILASMVPDDKRQIIDGCWMRFKACVAGCGAVYEPTIKTMLDVYARLYSSKVQGRIFIADSYGDPEVWDWDAPVLDSLKNFLRTEVLNYCSSQ